MTHWKGDANQRSIVAMVSFAFGVVGIIACALCKDVDHKMTNKVSSETSATASYLLLTGLRSRSKFISKTLNSGRRINFTDISAEHS